MSRAWPVAVVALLFFASAPAWAAHDTPTQVAVYQDWMEGHFPVGLITLGLGAVDDGDPVPPLGVGPINLVRVALPIDPCHRALFVDLLYDPTETRVTLDEDNWVSIPYEWRLELFDPAGERLASRPVFQPQLGIPMGEQQAPGLYRLDVYLLQGLDVDWSLRVRGLPGPSDPQCLQGVHINELEANPAGDDGGNEWLELYNAGPWSVDLAGWTLEATHGRPATLTLDGNVSLGPGERRVITFNGSQFLDNRDEVIELRSPLGLVMDRTPSLTDTADDDRTNQRVPEVTGSWVFVAATPGSPPP